MCSEAALVALSIFFIHTVYYIEVNRVTQCIRVEGEAEQFRLGAVSDVFIFRGVQ